MSSNAPTSDEGIVKVIVSLRPLIGKELTVSPLSCLESSDTLLTIYPPSGASLTFSFDHIHSSTASQEEIYDSGPVEIIQAVLQGFNGTILTYGQESSGKTYTMFGDLQDPAKMGIIPRIINTAFEIIDSANEETEFIIKVSFCEIYMEKIYDLLHPKTRQLKLKDSKKGCYIENLREVYTTCEFDIIEVIKVGILNKNSRDSMIEGRDTASHSIFSITVQQKLKDFAGKAGKLFLVDLAGSEKYVPGSPSRLGNLKAVNTSLTSLGIVIISLTEKPTSFVPYRASKLTRILQESLGGNSKTVLIITCSPSPLNFEETLSSLRFATRVKAVKNYPIVNREHSIEELKQKLLYKLDTLKKLTRRLSLLEDAAEQAKKHRESLILSVRFITAEELSPRETGNFSELQQEYEEVNMRIAEQEGINRKLEETIENNRIRIAELLERLAVQNPVMEGIEKKAYSLDEELRIDESVLEGIMGSIEVLNIEYETQNREIEEIELKIEKLTAQIEHFKCQIKCWEEMRSDLSTAALEEQFLKRIKEEKEKNKSIKLDMKKIQHEIDIILFRKYKGCIEVDSMQSAEMRAQELKLELDKARMEYAEDEKMMTPLQRIAKTNRDALELTAEAITKDFRHLTSKYSQSELDKLMNQRKLVRLEEKCEKLMEDIGKVDKKLIRVDAIKSNCSNLGEINKLLQKGAKMNSSLAARRLQYSIMNEV